MLRREERARARETQHTATAHGEGHAREDSKHATINYNTHSSLQTDGDRREGPPGIGERALRREGAAHCCRCCCCREVLAEGAVEGRERPGGRKSLERLGANGSHAAHTTGRGPRSRLLPRRSGPVAGRLAAADAGPGWRPPAPSSRLRSPRAAASAAVQACPHRGAVRAPRAAAAAPRVDRLTAAARSAEPSCRRGRAAAATSAGRRAPSANGAVLSATRGPPAALH
eukprot:scaffold57311_cov56-Phaeocystis_antarctica.AAC.6